MRQTLPHVECFKKKMGFNTPYLLSALPYRAFDGASLRYSYLTGQSLSGYPSFVFSTARFL